MKLIDILKGSRPLLSCEVFPPKSEDGYNSVKQATEEIAALRPAYVSVTCGAGGSGGSFNVDIAKNIRNKYRVEPLVHLTCVSSSADDIGKSLKAIEASGIQNILALRGDLPAGAGGGDRRDFPHASDLVSEIKRQGDFCVGGACYPEGHPESRSLAEDIGYLKLKVEAGCDFLTTQMFFNNAVLYDFLERLEAAGISVPVNAGIMPVTNAAQIKRICELSGTVLPRRFMRIVEKFGDDPLSMKQAGIVYASEQIIDLYANGIRGVHLYTMNKPDVASRVMEGISAIIAG